MALYLIVLLEGFVTISLEILTIRQLTPLFGNSIIVTSLIIGIFLLFLAYGYRKGGTYQESYKEILQNNFIFAAIGCGIGLSYLFIEFFFHLLRIILPSQTLLPLTLYLLVIIAPTVYFLGQTVPITLNLWRKDLSIGETGGQILHLSTLGSFLGATLTALLLLNYLGVGWSIFINFAILLWLIHLLTDVPFYQKKTRLIILSVVTVIVYSANIFIEKNIFALTNNYGNYLVSAFNNDKNGQPLLLTLNGKAASIVGERITKNFIKDEAALGAGKLFMINDSHSSYLNKENKGYPYLEIIKKILFVDLQLTHKNILVLGAGGFTLSAEKTYDNHFLYVDIDKKIAEVVKKYFLTSIKGDFIADDARHFLNTTEQHFDVIVSDVCNSRMSIPAHLLTQEYFAAVKNKLAENGIAIFNIPSEPTLHHHFAKRIDSTIRSVFNNCMVIPVSYVAKNHTNVLYTCQKSNNEEDKHIYTDNLNRATLDFYSMT